MIEDPTEITLTNLQDDNVRNHTITLNILKNGGTIGNKFKLQTVDGIRFLITGIMY